MEEFSKLVVDLEVVDKRETGGKSAAMEKLAEEYIKDRACCNWCFDVN